MDIPSIGGVAALRPLWLSDLKEQGEAAVRWLWQGYLAAGSLTLLTSQWKAGKTTLLALLLDRMKRGGELAGAAVEKGKAVIVSEEPVSLWLQRSQRFNFGKHVCWLCRPFPQRPSAAEWSALIEQLLGLHEQLGLSLVAIDPLAGFLPVRSENDAAEMLTALLPLQRLTSAGLSVLVLHHPRKQARADGQAARGSGALSGHADILLEMHWVAAAAEEDRRRRLLAWSRHEETPRRRTIELSADGCDYAVVAEVEDDPQQPVREALWRVLEDSPIKLTQAEIVENWPEGERRPVAVTLWRLLDRCVESGALKRDAAGTRNDPYRYWLPELEQRWRTDAGARARQQIEEVQRAVRLGQTPTLLE